LTVARLFIYRSSYRLHALS